MQTGGTLLYGTYSAELKGNVLLDDVRAALAIAARTSRYWLQYR
jgi:hypothetical protein